MEPPLQTCVGTFYHAAHCADQHPSRPPARPVDVPAVATPSIKGSIFSRAAEDVRKLVADGTLARGELERRSRGRIWRCRRARRAGRLVRRGRYGRLLELLRELAGNGRDEYLRRRGAQSAEALLAAGFYQQMEYLSRAEVRQHRDPQLRFAAFGRDLRLLTSLHGSILNFGQQAARVDPGRADRYLIEITDAAPLPEPLCWTTDGFVNRMASEHGSADLWRWERPTRELIVFRMLRDA